MTDISVVGVVGPVSVGGGANICYGVSGCRKGTLEKSSIGISWGFIESICDAVTESQDTESS